MFFFLYMYNKIIVIIAAAAGRMKNSKEMPPIFENAIEIKNVFALEIFFSVQFFRQCSRHTKKQVRIGKLTVEVDRSLFCLLVVTCKKISLCGWQTIVISLLERTYLGKCSLYWFFCHFLFPFSIKISFLRFVPCFFLPFLVRFQIKVRYCKFSSVRALSSELKCLRWQISTLEVFIVQRGPIVYLYLEPNKTNKLGKLRAGFWSHDL